MGIMNTKGEIGKVRKDIKTLMKVIDANQRFIGDLMTRVEYLEKKEVTEKKTLNSNMYQ